MLDKTKVPFENSHILTNKFYEKKKITQYHTNLNPHSQIPTLTDKLDSSQLNKMQQSLCRNKPQVFYEVLPR